MFHCSLFYFVTQFFAVGMQKFNFDLKDQVRFHEAVFPYPYMKTGNTVGKDGMGTRVDCQAYSNQGY